MIEDKFNTDWKFYIAILLQLAGRGQGFISDRNVQQTVQLKPS